MCEYNDIILTALIFKDVVGDTCKSWPLIMLETQLYHRNKSIIQWVPNQFCFCDGAEVMRMHQ